MFTVVKIRNGTLLDGGNKRNVKWREEKSGSTVYSIFIDFRRAFDSVPHSLLWSKLFNLGLSSKILNVLIDLYNKAEAYVKLRGDKTRNFEITEGVLQGEILSPLLFILFVSDFEDFFRDKGFRGLSIDSMHDILLPTYADDSALLCHTPIDVKKKLDSETLLASGRILKTEKEAFFYDNETLETVNKYEYLGVLLESNMNCVGAASHAIRKAKMAIGITKSILVKSKSDAWGTKIKLFDSVVSPTLFYAVASWGIGHFEQIEKIQIDYYKQILLLPAGTPGVAVRMELGLKRLAIKALDLTIGWLIRILRMGTHRLPLIDMEFLGDCLDAEVWSSHKAKVLSRYHDNLRAQDFLRYYECPHYQHLRLARLREIVEERFEVDWLPTLLDIKNPKELKRLAFFIIEALEFRDRQLNQSFEL
ncbi:uncharacterized protein LOC114841502 [Diachasma alloeum]|uniref:uncharacterized protein LOC114841502 n=1 Tax=Diachasma alloeum TaxID=454923 RepID=UPI0010FB7AE1|nr:uncharacterized protein LOC114841502 [Diachasma alloeum]